MASVDWHDTSVAPVGVARVLIVDDHALLRTGVANIINQEPGFEVVAEASNGREAIDAFLVHRPDVILMDLRMPEMEGVEAVKRRDGSWRPARPGTPWRAPAPYGRRLSCRRPVLAREEENCPWLALD